MSNIEPEELIRARDLIQVAKFEEAEKLIQDFKRKSYQLKNEKISYYILKALLYDAMLDWENSFKYIEKAFSENQGLENIHLLDIYLLMAQTSYFGIERDIKKSLNFIEKAESLLETLDIKPKTEFLRRKAKLYHMRALYYRSTFEYSLALKNISEAISIQEKMDLKVDLILSLIDLTSIFFIKSELDLSHKYIEQYTTLAKKVDYKIGLYMHYIQKSAFFYFKGDLNQALELQKEALVLARKLNLKREINYSLKNLGLIYQEQGNFKLAQKVLEENLELCEKYDYTSDKSYAFHALFHLSIKKGDLKQAKYYLDQFKEFKDLFPVLDVAYRVNKAVFLKTSPRVINRGKAEEILKKVIKEEIGYELAILALINLCDLLLIELRNTNNPEVIDDLQLYISQLQNVAEKSHSYNVFAESFLLKARLALITLDLKNARRLLTQAQRIADKYRLRWLAIKISNEHDELLKKLDVWEKLKESKAPLSERMKLARPNEQMERMIYKREIAVPELTDEDPIILLIISEGGRPVFSESFVEEWALEDHLFGGLLTAINSFSDQMFSEGLNRANFGDYTIIMNSLDPFLVCYLFKGQSYLAQRRVLKFIDHIKDDKNIWNTFNDYNQSCREVQLKDIPSLEPLIKEIFIDKSIQIEGLL